MINDLSPESYILWFQSLERERERVLYLNSSDIVGTLFNLSHPPDMVAQVKLQKSSVMDSPSTISVSRRLAQFSHSDAPRLILSVHRQA